MTLTTALMIACASLSLIEMLWIMLLWRARRRETHHELEAVQQVNTAIENLDDAVRGVNVLKSTDLLAIVHGLEVLRDEVEKVASSIGAIASRPAEPSRDPVAIEHQILGELWKQFRANQELSAAFDEALEDRAWGRVLDELKGVVPVDLRSTFDSVVIPCREHRMFVQKLDLIPRVISGKIPRLGTDAEEMRRTRELAALLTSDAESRLVFRFKTWVTDVFLPFADLYLQRYQQAQLELRADELQDGASLVRRVLEIASVEAIEITPGQTPFDSTCHIGRSTSNDPRFPDGVITGVVRNGFIEGGRLILRQPEVVVNRMR